MFIAFREHAQLQPQTQTCTSPTHPAQISPDDTGAHPGHVAGGSHCGTGPLIQLVAFLTYLRPLGVLLILTQPLLIDPCPFVSPRLGELKSPTVPTAQSGDPQKTWTSP
jgi:hypothetical protein